jgi:tetratricopeptide (TPR) repeat protein
MSLAIALEKAGDLPSAIEHYEQALRLNPQFVEARQYLAAAHITAAMASASVGQATEHFVRAVQLRPDDLSLRYNLALSLANLGQPGLAVEHLRAALQIDPTSPHVLDLLSQIHAQRGDMAKAIQLATRALQAAPHRGDEKLAASIAQKLKIYQDASKPP